MPVRLASNVALPLLGFLLGTALWFLFFNDAAFAHPQPIASPPSAPAADTQSEDPAWSRWDDITHFFVFGDANSDTYFDPLDPAQPGASAPFGNTARVAPDAAAHQPTKWIEHALQHTPRWTYNLARPGALIETYAYAPHPAGVLRAAQDASGKTVEDTALHEQVDRFLALYTTSTWQETRVNWTSGNTLFTVWVGAEEIARAMQHEGTLAATPIYASYLASLERLYLAGARNFLIINTPPVDKVARDPFKTVQANVRLLNQQINKACIKLLRRHPSVTLFLYDAHRLCTEAIADPPSFEETAKIVYVDRQCDRYAAGGSDSVKECSQPRDAYFWLSAVNISAPVHRLLGRQVVRECFGGAKPVERCSNGIADT